MNAFNALLLAFSILAAFIHAAQHDVNKSADFKTGGPVKLAIEGINGKLGANSNGNFVVLDAASPDNVWTYYPDHECLIHSTGYALTKKMGARREGSVRLEQFREGDESQKWTLTRRTDMQFHGRNHYIRYGKFLDVGLEINDSYLDDGQGRIQPKQRVQLPWKSFAFPDGNPHVFATLANYGPEQEFKIEVVQ